MGKNITLGFPPVKDGAFTRRRRLPALLQAARKHPCAGRRRRNVGPFYDSPPKGRPQRDACKADAYLRIPRSAEVSASENAGRENSRSAYFMSGAACFGIWTP